MLHGSETWPVRKENEVALQSAEMRMVRWMCGIKVREFQERLGLDYSKTGCDGMGMCCEKKTVIG